MAKNPPPRRPSSARGRSMCPSADRSKNDRPVSIMLRIVSLCPSKIGGYDTVGAISSPPSLSSMVFSTAPERQLDPARQQAADPPLHLRARKAGGLFGCGEGPSAAAEADL